MKQKNKRGFWKVTNSPPWFMKSEGMMSLNMKWYKLKWFNLKAKGRTITKENCPHIRREISINKDWFFCKDCQSWIGDNLDDKK